MAGKRRIFIDWEQQPLGRVSDYKLALRLRVSRGTVLRARLARGIKALGRVSLYGNQRDMGVDECLEELDAG